jgi:exopolysaccharide biosynthesis WecB/TagA/CpsF family protein
MVSSSPVLAPLREVRFAGLRFTPLTVEAAVTALASRPAAAKFDVFITPNAEHAFLKRGNPEFIACSDEAFVSTNDSRVLRRAAYLAGIELEFAPGAYVVADLFRSVIDPDTPITIIGCEPDIVARLVEHFGLKRVNHHNPPMGMIRNPQAVTAAIEYIVAHPAPFVFVAMGPPQSEQFCQRVIEDGRATGIGLCIGSSLSVLTRTTNPAPDWMEQSGLVWLYRLATEPKRLWKRYLVRGVYSLGLSARDIIAIRLGLRRAVDV